MAKASELLHKSVFIETSQTTKDWDPTEWLCDIRAEDVARKSREIARALKPDVEADSNDSQEKYVFASCTSGKTFYANAEPIYEVFKKEDDLLDFKKSFENGFVSAWSAKTARTAKLPPGVKRVRIAGLGVRTKRNGFRVVAAEVETKNTSEAFRFFHLLRIDDKLEREDYLSDQDIKKLDELRAELKVRYPKFPGLDAVLGG